VGTQAEFQDTEFIVFVHEIMELFRTNIGCFKTVCTGISKCCLQWWPLKSSFFFRVCILSYGVKESNYCRSTDRNDKSSLSRCG
jgi:hypothetical protein